MEFNLPDPKDNLQLKPELLEKHLNQTKGGIVTRFPPEPNGYLHIGHAKAMYVNFTFAKSKGGICYMRFDDTNPSKEKQEYIESILEDVTWMGHQPYKITYTSDYFDQLYEFAIQMIKSDKAYVCQLDDETMRKNRYDCIESPYRNRPIEESLMLFNQMKEGQHKEGSMTLRMKGDMHSCNPTMRDLVAYRILFKEHPRTGNKWVIYATYDYSHPIVDSLENITHSMCSIEFQSRNELYRWIPGVLGIYQPPQIEYSRLNITHTILSKRKLIELVNDGIVSGWSDPRMPTLKGLRRRGYTAESILDFCNRVGLCLATTTCGVISCHLLEECLRQNLETRAPRVMAVMNPLKVIIVNVQPIIQTFALDFPNLGDKSSQHTINVGNVVYIEKDDFRTQDSPKYFRLAPNKIVRLKYLGLVKCLGFTTDSNQEVTQLSVELLSKDFKPEKRVQGTINWISEIDHVNVEVRKYDYLFPQELDESKDWKTQLNRDSMSIMNVMTDRSILRGKPFDNFQFERIGYFCIDPDTTTDKVVMNLSIPLKEDKNK